MLMQGSEQTILFLRITIYKKIYFTTENKNM